MRKFYEWVAFVGSGLTFPTVLIAVVAAFCVVGLIFVGKAPTESSNGIEGKVKLGVNDQDQGQRELILFITNSMPERTVSVNVTSVGYWYIKDGESKFGDFPVGLNLHRYGLKPKIPSFVMNPFSSTTVSCKVETTLNTENLLGWRVSGAWQEIPNRKQKILKWLSGIPIINSVVKSRSRASIGPVIERFVFDQREVEF